jgi:hypothetical protein
MTDDWDAVIVTRSRKGKYKRPTGFRLAGDGQEVPATAVETTVGPYAGKLLRYSRDDVEGLWSDCRAVELEHGDYVYTAGFCIRNSRLYPRSGSEVLEDHKKHMEIIRTLRFLD